MYLPGVRRATSPLGNSPSIGKKLISAVSQRALFHRLGSHTPRGCPGPMVPLPSVPTAPLSARYEPQNLSTAPSAPFPGSEVLAATLGTVSGRRATPEARVPIVT